MKRIAAIVLILHLAIPSLPLADIHLAKNYRSTPGLHLVWGAKPNYKSLPFESTAMFFFFNACSASGAVVSDSATNWTSCGGTFPQVGDTVSIGNNNLTITANTTFDVGTTPADDTTQVCCTTAAGTGAITVGAGAKFIYRGHVLFGVNGITFGAGSSFVHGGVGTQRYSVVCGNTNNSGCTITVNGTTGAGRVTFRKATTGLDGINGIASGGIQCPACFAGTNNLNASYLTVTDFGTASVQAWVFPPDTGSNGTEKFSCDHCLWNSNDGEIDLGGFSATGILSLTNSTFYNTVATIHNGAMLMRGNAPLTSGTRNITNVVMQGLTILPPTSGTTTGLSFSNVIFVNSGAQPELDTAGNNIHGVSGFTNIMYWNDSTAGGLNATLPCGSYSRVMGLRSGSTADSDKWEAGKMQCNLTWTGGYYENQLDDQQGDAVVAHSDSAAGVTITIKNLVVPCNDNGNGVGSLFTTVAVITNLVVNIDHNTFCGNTIKGLLDMENAAVPASAFLGPSNNIVYRGASVACFFTATAGGITANANTYVGADYNFSNNCSGSVYLKGSNALTNAAFASPSPPGTHDQTSINPNFTDSTRRLLSWAATIDATVTTWAGVKAKLIAMNDDSGFNTGFTLAAFYDWVRPGYVPRNTSFSRAGSDGSTIGAMPMSTTQTQINGIVNINGGAIIH